MKKLVLATLAVVLFGGVAFASECGDWAVQQTASDEQWNVEHGEPAYSCVDEANSICGYYNLCMTH
ncbi:MAG: hypothetical protein GZ087_15470 [Flavobacterium sp.]|nr:hypothetical protein [Flavobacterium sp.]